MRTQAWWLEEIEDGSFVLIHVAKGRDVACRINLPPAELRTRLAEEICELRQLVEQSILWVTN
jgi:hypothetical protein